MPAIEESIKTARQSLDVLKNNGEPATFENTIVALEAVSDRVGIVAGVYQSMYEAHADKKLQDLAVEINPKLAALSSDVSLDLAIFNRIKEVYDKRDQFELTTEQSTVLERHYKSFVRNGALLSDEAKKEIRQIDQELSVLGPKFSANVLGATNSFQMVIDKKKELEGFPDGVLEAAAYLAATNGHDGKWMINLTVPSYLSVMTYAKDRHLRKKVWYRYASRAFNDKYDNQEILKRIVQLRHRRANILGYKTHADFALEESMAQTPETVESFLKTIEQASYAAAQKDIEEIRSLAKELDGISDLQHWDVVYYAEKLKEQKYAFNEEDLRPYFKMENVVDGVFAHAKELYGLIFKENKSIPVYHPEVKVYEVHDEASKRYMGLLYTDFFPRETKKAGGWMTQFRHQGFFEGRIVRPHISIVCNFTKPTPTKPSLMTYNEVRTLFHEFGHALHGILSDVTYHSVSGTNVYLDFVELPSQIFENWVGEEEGLALLAKHYESGAPMPKDLIKKLKEAQRFQAGWLSCRQLQFAILDMAWHSMEPLTMTDVDSFEDGVIAKVCLLPKIPGTNISVIFSHIFAGGYAAGYYSYKWAEVLDADAFALFLENGLFNRDIAKRFREHVLSKGGTEHPMSLYKRFRGREPDAKALLRREGFVK